MFIEVGVCEPEGLRHCVYFQASQISFVDHDASNRRLCSLDQLTEMMGESKALAPRRWALSEFHWHVLSCTRGQPYNLVELREFSWR